jgi:hypothetical protein
MTAKKNPKIWMLVIEKEKKLYVRKENLGEEKNL